MLVFALAPEAILAEDSTVKEGFSMSPFFQEVTLTQDQARTDFALEISNNTNASAVFKLSVADFGALDETGGVSFLGTSVDSMNKYSLASWVSLEKDALVLNQGESQTIKVSIENREALSPGGHYAAIVAQMENEVENSIESESLIALQPSFASLIFVRKVGGEIFGLNLQELDFKPNFFNLSSKVYLRFQNTGNVHLTPRGIITITDPFGRQVYHGIINSESALILPETFRLLPVLLQKRGFIFMPGRYKLAVSYRYDGQENFSVIEKTFDFVPLSAMLACLTIFVAGGVYAKAKFSKKGKKEKSKSQQGSSQDT